MIYLDWAATAIPDGAIARKATEEALTFFANPSAGYSAGKNAAEKRDECRSRCKKILDAPADSFLVFTSGGTEANNLILSSFLKPEGARHHFIISSIEHASALEPARTLERYGHSVKFLAPESCGRLSTGRLARHISRETRMVSIMQVNNETGAIQPIQDLAALIREKEKEYGSSIHFHMDGVQALGKIPFSLKELDVDSASFSAHKTGGPRGTGLLYLKKSKNLLFQGGGQEAGFRPGTENLQGILGMTLALEKAEKNREENFRRARELNRILTEGLREIPQAEVLPSFRKGNPEGYVPWILTVSIQPIPGEVLMRVLDQRGVAVSTGAACSRNKKDKTRSLQALGIGAKAAFSAIRISTGPETTEKEIQTFLKILGEEVGLLARIKH